MESSFAIYLPHIRQRWLDEQAGWEKRRQLAWDKAQQIAALLSEQFRATQVIVFGSLIQTGSLYDEHSDIDLAVSGIVADDFFRAFGAVTAVANPFQVDLIDLDTAPPKLVESIRTQGVVL